MAGGSSNPDVLSVENEAAVGTVLRSHAGGYLVNLPAMDTSLQCQARGRLKKERVSIVTGDRVLLDEIDLAKDSAVITGRMARDNILSRPLLANVDQIIIVQAVHQPDWNPSVCDRYIVHFQLEMPDSKPILCFNKSDLAAEDEKAALRSIYEPLGYRVIIVSARVGEGMNILAELLAGRITVFAGQSGVGKSSLLNYLEPELNLKVGVMENDFGVGRHTTTASELYRLNPDHLSRLSARAAASAWVADTPGFQLSEFKHPDPQDVAWQFPEIAELAADCKFSDCLHLVERGCNVLANLDRLRPERYESYAIIVRESQEVYLLRRDTSQKLEATVKQVGGRAGKGKQVPRLSNRYRASSRRAEKQQLSRTAEFEEDDAAELEEDIEESADAANEE